MDTIRLLLAALCSFIALLASASFAFKVLPENTPPWLTGVVLAAFLILFAVLMLVVLNLGRRKPPPGPTLAPLEAQGLVVSTDFRATRAFEVEEFEDEGRHYFMELADGTVLYLNGQYLYDYGIDPDSREEKDSTGFPNTEFTVRRHSAEDYVLDIICKGKPLKPEATAPPFGGKGSKVVDIRTDGDIIRDRTYDLIKAECMAARQT